MDGFLICRKLRKNKEVGPSDLLGWCLFFILFSVCAKPSILNNNITKKPPPSQEISKISYINPFTLSDTIFPFYVLPEMQNRY
ncbi:MAG: hypothetical protein A2Y10_14300 [Planctomycetes bacterium GWF2_41_51]|nr:MAG: hypothetical protein A2Y10_14300 [Planctomycetes bacterium GWF2_41_51]HBG28737.1 hypothetical protein [Phycisphaerales bacterium]